MSATVICQGCGQAFDVPEGYGRNKIQCPGCGVICPVPEGGGAAPARPRRAEPARDVEAEAAEALAGPAPRRAAAEAPAAVPAPAPAAPAPAAADPWGQEGVPLAREVLPPREEGERGDPEPVRRKVPELWFHCRRCRRKVRRQGECPVCDAAPEPPLEMEPAPVGVAPRSLELDEPAPVRPAGEEEEDGTPYELADRLLPRCPKCSK